MQIKNLGRLSDRRPLGCPDLNNTDTIRARHTQLVAVDCGNDMRFAPLICAWGFISYALGQTLTSAVQWDSHSLIINNERVFIQSGEFHYPRLPVPTLWRDVLQKFKANGLNTVSLYFFWSYHSPRPGVFDFETPGRDIQHLLDIAQEEKLWVIARPGPYVNGETNGGGFPLWGSDGSLGRLRTDNETYHQAWSTWIQAVGPILARNQISKGGPVILWQIENELSETVHSPNNTLVKYMEQIEDASRAVGIDVPFTSNEKGMRAQSWSSDYENVGGAVNVYGLDSYPGGLSCTNPNSGFNIVRTYHEWFHNYSYTQPSFFPEFEGGYFQPWGGSFYDACVAEHSPEFPDVYYKNNIGQGITMQSLYMGFGGTNWGNLGAPVVYTSYDYSAPLNERREITTKFMQTKLINLFTRASSDLPMTTLESHGAGNQVSNDEVYSWVLRHDTTKAAFYVLQQNKSSSTANVATDVNVQTLTGNLTIANVQLAGRQSKIISTDYTVGKFKLLHSSCDILNWAEFDQATVLVLYAPLGQECEFALNSEQTSPSTYGPTKLSESRQNSSTSTYATWRYTQSAGSTAVHFADGLVIWLLETETAWTFFAPSVSSTPHVGSRDQVFVLGPYLVRSAQLDGPMLRLVGDTSNSTVIEVFARSAQVVLWNGQPIATSRTPYGTLKAQLAGAQPDQLALPQSLSWLRANSLPESQPDYDDSRWTVCNKMSSLSPEPPITLPVLFSSDYGFYPGIKIYRGYFDQAMAASVNMTVSGGFAAGFSCWLNGQFIGSKAGTPSQSSVSAMMIFPRDLIRPKGNVLSVVVDYTGHDETSTAAGVENPRGIKGAQLRSSNGTLLSFSKWKIQGNAGGDANIDPVRGSMNEGGLHGTRLGWHLPGFQPLPPLWTEASPATGINSSGIAWYRTEFELSIPPNMDVPLGLELGSPSGTNASIEIYINGYQFGKFLPHIGPQTSFPFPPGIVNLQGSNTLSIAMWAMDDTGACLQAVRLFPYGAYRTGIDWVRDARPLQPLWSPSRKQYV